MLIHVSVDGRAYTIHIFRGRAGALNSKIQGLGITHLSLRSPTWDGWWNTLREFFRPIV